MRHLSLFAQRKLLLVFMVFVVGDWISSSAHGAAMDPGTAIVVPAETNPDPGSTVLSTVGPIPFSALTFTGTLTSMVLTNDSTNPFGLDKLTFTYELTNTDNDGVPTNLSRFTVSRFTGFDTDASYRDTGGVAPSVVDRDAIGDVVGFSFLPEPVGSGVLASGLSSATLVFQTDAMDFTSTLAAVIDGSIAIVDSVAPKEIPEPGTAAVLGLACSMLLRRRRR